MVKNLAIGIVLLGGILLGGLRLGPVYLAAAGAEKAFRKGVEAGFSGRSNFTASHFKQAIKLRPAADLAARIGLAYHIQEDFAEGLPYLQQAFAEEPQQPWAVKVALAAAYADAGEEEKGKAMIAEALSRLPEDPGIMNNLAYPMADGDILVDEAAIMLKKAVRRSPKSWEILDSLGWAYYRQGKLEEAKAILAKALEMHSDEIVFQHLQQVNRDLQAETKDPRPR